MTKNYSLQALRAIAALLVVFAHSMTQINMAKDIGGNLGHIMKTFESFGGLGVYIFFIISGYIMSYTTNNKNGGTDAAFDFLKKRFLRVYPVYWICLTVLLIGWGMGIFLKSHDYSINKIIFSYMLVPFTDVNSDSINPVLSQGWTLMYEVFFYLTFSFLLFFHVNSWKKIFYLFLSYSLIYICSLTQIVAFDAFNIFFQKGSFFLFIVGMIIFELETKAKKMMSELRVYLFFVFLSLLMTFFAFISAFNIHENLIMYPLAVIVFLLFNTHNINNKYLNLLGDASYSIYLTHGFLVMLFGNIIKRFDFPFLYVFISAIIPFCCSLIVGVYFYRYVELKVIYKSKLIFN